MDLKTAYPDFAAIEHHIRRARAERTVAVAHAIVGFIELIGRGMKKFSDALARGVTAERDRYAIERHAIEADPFLKRSVPRY